MAAAIEMAHVGIRGVDERGTVEVSIVMADEIGAPLATTAGVYAPGRISPSGLMNRFSAMVFLPG
ncbi:MAG TPA: hypothetical protein VFB99_13840 [Vicinamibacterales bacterium]|nr:hypothetical protein [Vicinamibacterales bacterium]